MKKFIAIVFVLMLMTLLLVGCGDDVVTTNNNPKVFVASGHPEWWPIMFKQDTQIVGVGSDLTKLIANDLNLTVYCEYGGSWDVVLEAAKQGKVDVIVGAYKTTEREQYLYFSDSYTTDPVAVFVKTGQSFPYDKMEDLVGKKGVAMVGDSYGQTLDDFIVTNLAVVRVGTVAEAFSLLLNGEADYFLYSYYAGRKEIFTNYVGQFESLPTYAAEEAFYLAISKKSSLVVYLPQINGSITKYKNDGTVNNLIQNYMK